MALLGLLVSAWCWPLSWVVSSSHDLNSVPATFVAKRSMEQLLQEGIGYQLDCQWEMLGESVEQLA